MDLVLSAIIASSDFHLASSDLYFLIILISSCKQVSHQKKDMKGNVRYPLSLSSVFLSHVHKINLFTFACK